MKMAVPEQQNSADGDTVELPIGIDETVTARETIEHAQEQLEDQVIRCRCSVLVRDIAAAGQFNVCDKIIFKTQ